MGMDKIRVYIACRQNTDTQEIAACTIISLFMEAERNPVLRLSRQWWEQPDLDIPEIRAGHAYMEAGGETGKEE